VRQSRGEVWAVTTIFNPAGFRSMMSNYRRFRAELKVPLAVAELGFGGRWELTEHDADMLLRVTDGDVMWQKERLINLLVANLPAECKYVAWIDADVLLRNPDWPRQAVLQLASSPLVQLFSTARNLERDGTVPQACRPSAASVALGGENPLRPKTKHGMGWAARRELLERHGLYDTFVIGGGDTAMLGAAYGTPEVVVNAKFLSAGHRDHYLRWADGFYADVQGRVGVVEGEIHHLWHGDLEDRRYGGRHEDLAQHDFDPRTDIRTGREGAWRWATDKPALHALLHDYFHSRMQDGRTATGATRSADGATE
jgi:hypothetical protein